jgi:hypothetical protein
MEALLCREDSKQSARMATHIFTCSGFFCGQAVVSERNTQNLGF